MPVPGPIEEGTGASRIGGVLLDGDVEGVIGGQKSRIAGKPVAAGEARNHIVPVDGHGARPPDALIGQRAGSVEVPKEREGEAGGVVDHPEGGVGPERGQHLGAGTIDVGGPGVDLAGAKGGQLVADRRHLEALHERAAEEVVVVGHVQQRASVAGIGLEPVGARTHEDGRISSSGRVADLGPDVFGDDGQRARRPLGEGVVGADQLDPHAVVVESLDLGHPLGLDHDERAERVVGVVPKGEGHVVGGEGSTVVPADPFP